ncbi:hypothetical protein GH714_018023 [Hevea brasiliensis]|uniref:MIF4G domain-containing protein n=1 Tax=Hevea brasiliensis TaxID=3981 RepID=A0A6A6LY98_HEVBR|nr:hypothetical protein GH714_018023 [Hevea brasiliensis]
MDALRKSINGLVNKINASNIKNIIPELFLENLIRGRGLFCRSCMKSQIASPAFTDVLAALVAILNAKVPEVGNLLLRRIVLQLKRAYKRNDKMELCIMLLECCNQERTYLLYYVLLGQRFCMIDNVYQENFEKCFVQQYSMIHWLETNKLRNMAKFFAHLLGTDALPWHVLAYIRLTEEDTTSYSCMFIKILFQQAKKPVELKELEGTSKAEVKESEEISKREMKEREEMSKAFQAIAEVREEVDKLAERVSALEVAVNGGTKIAEEEFAVSSELLMKQLLKLDTIQAEGEAKVQRKAEVHRVQNYHDLLDNLKSSNSKPFNNSSNAVSVTTEWETFDSGPGNLSPPPLSSSTRITQDWERFD